MVDVAGKSREGTFEVDGSGATGFDGKFHYGSSLRENMMFWDGESRNGHLEVPILCIQVI